MQPQTSRTLRLAFGPFEFDRASCELSKHGYKVKLPSQPGRILGALVERPGELVSREHLRDRLWPGATAGDFEHGLNAAVNKLRQALSDEASQPRYVETVPGLGYRFVAPVHPVGGALLELVPAAAAVPAGERPAPLLTPMRAVAVALPMLLLLGAASWWALRRSPPETPVKPAQFSVLPPKGYYFEGGGLRQAFALSPDGERLAFTAKDESGAFRLFLREFSELESRPVPDGEGAYSVVWTPDGQTLLFTAHGKLRRTGLQAGASQVLSSDVPYFSSAIPFGEGRLLVSNDHDSGVLPAAGGSVQPNGRSYPWAQLLPGEKEFLYTIGDPQLGALRARIATVGGSGEGVEVVQAGSRVQYTGSLHSDSGYLLYLREGTLLAQPFDLERRRATAEPKAVVRRISSFPVGAADFSVSRRGVLAYQTYINRSQFIWVDRAGRKLSTTSPPDLNASFARLSPDGRWIAAVPYDVERGVFDIWLYDALTGAGRKAIFGAGLRHHPVWSPDSRRLAHINADHYDWPKVGLSSIDGTPDAAPMPNTGFMCPTDWSPDGRFLLYNNSLLPAVTEHFAGDVFAIDMERNRKVIPLLNTPFHESFATFSPDGKWLAYLSNESGQAEIYLQALDRGNDSLRVTGERFLLSRQGAQCLRWRKNGKELYYLAFDGRVYAVPLVWGGPGKVRAGEPVPLFKIDAESRATIHAVPSFDVSADGNRFVIPSVTPGESSALVVMKDWESLVGK